MTEFDSSVFAATADGPPGQARLPSRRCRRRPAAAARQASVSRPVLADGMLKLMLILLAFFVFLHSRSEFAERKVTPILDALALRFAATAPGDGFAEAAALALLGDPGELRRRRLLGHLPISAAAIDVPGALVAFELDEAALFEPNGWAILRERLVLLHRVAGAIASGTAQNAHQLVVTTAWPSDDVELVTRRLAALRAIFGEMPGVLVQIRFGFGDLPAGRWRFVIRSAMPDAA